MGNADNTNVPRHTELISILCLYLRFPARLTSQPPYQQDPGRAGHKGDDNHGDRHLIGKVRDYSADLAGGGENEAELADLRDDGGDLEAVSPGPAEYSQYGGHKQRIGDDDEAGQRADFYPVVAQKPDIYQHADGGEKHCHEYDLEPAKAALDPSCFPHDPQ